MAKYYEFWEGEQKCSECGWTGLGSESQIGEAFSDLYEAECPKCGEKLCIVEYPFIEEMRERYDKLSKVDKLVVKVVETRTDRFEKEKLKSPDQLPQINKLFFVLTWDSDGERGPENVLIKLGDKVIWKELEWFEGWTRFIEVGDILKEKYGARLRDVIPTRAAEMDLYGDHLGAPGNIEYYRKTFKNSWLRKLGF